MSDERPRMKVVISQTRDVWWWEVQTVIGRTLTISHADSEEAARSAAMEWIERRDGRLVDDEDVRR